MPPGDLDPSGSCHDRVSRTPLDQHGKLGHWNAQTGARGIIDKDSHKAGECSPLTEGRAFQVSERRRLGALGVGIML